MTLVTDSKSDQRHFLPAFAISDTPRVASDPAPAIVQFVFPWLAVPPPNTPAVADWLGLAVCVGIGPSKTLAKLANHRAKMKLAGEAGVCDFTTMSATERLALFERIDVGEV